jgi:hypothetical protein
VPHHTLIGKSDWLDEGWSLVRQAAQIRRDDALRDQAAAFLAGISARLTKRMVGFKASAVAFGAADRYLLIGGSDEDEAKIWDSTTDEYQQSGLTGGGPVTFRPDGTAWQLVATKKDRFPLLLWDVGKRRLVRELSLPKPLTDGSLDELNVSEIVMTPGGEFAGALAKRQGAVALLTVWDTSNGEGRPANQPRCHDDRPLGRRRRPGGGRRARPGRDLALGR